MDFRDQIVILYDSYSSFLITCAFTINADDICPGRTFYHDVHEIMIWAVSILHVTFPSFPVPAPWCDELPADSPPCTYSQSSSLDTGCWSISRSGCRWPVGAHHNNQPSDRTLGFSRKMSAFGLFSHELISMYYLCCLSVCIYIYWLNSSFTSIFITTDFSHFAAFSPVSSLWCH